MHGVHSLVTSGVVFRSSAPGASSLSSVHQHFFDWLGCTPPQSDSDWLGCTPPQSDSSRGLVLRGERAAHQCSWNESGCSSFECLLRQAHRGAGRLHEQQHHCRHLSEEESGHHIEGVVWSGAGSCSVTRGSLGSADGLVHLWEEDHSARSAESLWPGPSDGVVSSSLGLWHRLWGLRLPPYRHVCIESKHKATFIQVSSSGSHVLETGVLPVPLGRSRHLHLPPLHSSLSDVVESDTFDKALLGSDYSFYVLKRSGSPINLPFRLKNLLNSPCCGTYWFRPTSGSFIVFSRPPCLQTWKLTSILSRRMAFWERLWKLSLRISEVPLQCSTGKWSRFLHWCCGWSLSLCKASVQAMQNPFSVCVVSWSCRFLRWRAIMLPLTMSFQLVSIWQPIALLAGCSAAPRSHVHLVRLNHQNTTWLVLQSLTRPPYEPIKLSSEKNLTWETCLLLGHSPAKRIGELHGLSFHAWHSRDWKSCTFSCLPDFYAKTQIPSVHDPCFEEFTIVGQFFGWWLGWASALPYQST